MDSSSLSTLSVFFFHSLYDIPRGICFETKAEIEQEKGAQSAAAAAAGVSAGTGGVLGSRRSADTLENNPVLMQSVQSVLEEPGLEGSCL